MSHFSLNIFYFSLFGHKDIKFSRMLSFPHSCMEIHLYEQDRGHRFKSSSDHVFRVNWSVYRSLKIQQKMSLEEKNFLLLL